LPTQVYRSLLRVLAGQYQAYNFIARQISIEVESADEEGTLFRSNSAAAKLFTFYMRMIGLKYLWHVLVLSVHSLNDNARETDPDRKPPPHEHTSFYRLPVLISICCCPGAGTGNGTMSSRMFGKKYRMDVDDLDEEEKSSVAMDILGVSSMELDPQVRARSN
jgi:hypothetical protein